MKLSILIPVFNEKETILEILRRVDMVKLNLEKEIIVIDDCSNDGTTDILRSLDSQKYKIFSTEKNSGKGAAIKVGLKKVSGDIIIIQDADLEYDPGDYVSMLGPILDNKVDVTLGSRVLQNPMKLFGSHRTPVITYMGHAVTTTLINLLYGQSGTDYYACYKMFRVKILKDITLEANGFDFDSEFVCKVFKKEIKVVEVPISYTPRAKNTGKKIKWHDAFPVIFSIIKWRFVS